MARRGGDGVHHVAVERRHVVDDRHRAAAEHVRRPHDEREADLRRDLARLFRRRRGAARRLRDAEIPQQLREPLAILGEVDRIRRGAEDADAGLLQRQRELQRRLPAVLDDAGDVAAGLLLARDDRRDVLEGQRLEVEAIDRVVVGRDRLGVAVDHHGLEPLLAQREGRVAAAVVELDALADAVRAAAEDDDLLPRRRVRFALLLVGAVQVRRERLEFRGAGVDPLVGGLRPCSRRARATASSSVPSMPPSSRSPNPARLSVRSMSRDMPRRPTSAGRALQLDDLRELREEPAVDLRELVELLDRPAALERAEERPHPPIVRHAQLALQRPLLFLGRQPATGCGGCSGRRAARSAELQRAERLHEGFLEGAADRHHLADRLHLRRQRPVGARELLERPARHLDDDVVDRRLEGRRRQARDVVRDLVEV